MDATKTCTKCGDSKPLEEFHRTTKNKSGRRSRCKVCTRADNLAAYHAQTPEQRKLHQETWRRYYYRNQGRLSKYAHYNRIRREHGLEPDEYEAIVARGCEVCGTHKGRICLDHDHVTGKVRGALCNKCNRAVGNLGDDPARARAVADYLERYQRERPSQESSIRVQVP